ncbi:hypothetical protein C1645_758630 [Glomus cerebriforme]|uniref:Uncharacterized protein n=1 Tax=Glomus cerebriforme TaxID=658196 RepID=A0A397TCF6_9GLOM|nr:hypothetical protein C1645_758630 [Glomus cerebriforme]
MEPITTSKTTTKINTHQIYPQPKNNRKSQIFAESSNSGDGGNGGEEDNVDIEGLEENGALAEYGDTPPTGDPFLLVTLRDSKRLPSRPKNVSYLYMIALLDLSIITVCTILLVHKGKQDHWHWREAAWDWIALGLVRFIVVIGIATSKWIRELRWVLGGVCCFSSLYIIFKANLIFQQKKPIDKYRLILLISSFLFCQIHWIAYVVVTTDNRRKARFLQNHSIYFEEEPSRPYVDGNNARIEDALNNTHPPTLRSYGATANRNDEIGVLANDENH